MSNLHIVADLLGITTESLMCELKKSDCPFGCCVKAKSGNFFYYVNMHLLKDWIREHPNRLFNNPEHQVTELSQISTQSLISELMKRRFVQ